MDNYYIFNWKNCYKMVEDVQIINMELNKQEFINLHFKNNNDFLMFLK